MNKAKKKTKKKIIDKPVKIRRSPFTPEQVMYALEEAIKINNIYAKALNARDGGQRTIFSGATAWMRRLKDLTLLI